ncbi:MAG: DUF3795 domain-containing protein [Candidatus Lokiarchaeia archaeon]
MDKNFATVCGLYCGTCEYLERECQGCGYQKGKPFWTIQMNVEFCPLYDCCVNKKQLEHCGLCTEFPCKTFTELRDPSLSEEEAEESLITRQNELLRRKEIGTEKWLEEREASEN